jgi:hypothetical protein
MEVGKTYYIKAHSVGKNSEPIPDKFQEYVTRVWEKDNICGSGWRVEILASTHQEVNTGIPDTKWGDHQSLVSMGHWFRVFFIGKDYQDDCMEIIRKFNKKDIPLCLGWAYCSDELLNRLAA